MRATLIDGTISGWPASILLERGANAHCAPYTGENDEPSPDEVMIKCHAITDACEGMPPSRALAKARTLGFVEESRRSH